MSFLVFGDVHGRKDVLQNLFHILEAEFGRNNLPPIYCTGDLLDRGPDAKGVIDLCLEKGVKLVLGNHELWMHQYLATGHFDDFALHSVMGGRATLISYGLDPDCNAGTIERMLKNMVPKTHSKFILEAPVYRKIVEAGVTYWLNHAALKQVDALAICGNPTDEQIFQKVSTEKPANMMWSGPNMKRPHEVYAPTKGIQVFGHIPVQRPVFEKHFVALDTGCGTTGQNLTAVLFPENKSWTVNSLTGVMSTPGFANFHL